MPLRVLWVIIGLGPGGAERLLVSLARVADPSVVQYQAAYLLPWKDHLVGELADAGVGATCLEASRVWHPSWLRRLRKLIVAGAFDIVHAHTPAVACGARLAVRSISPRRRPRLVYTEHNTWDSYRVSTRWLNAATCPLDDLDIAVSEAVRQSAWRRRRDEIRVVVHGVPLAEIRQRRNDRETTRAELGVGPGEVLIGTVANLRTEKDYPTLLAAADQVLRRCPQARYVAVGQGPLEAMIRARHSELGLGERFRLLGYRRDATRVLAACDVFTLASRHEGLPVALMEAFALGLPVVATAVGGILDVVRPGIDGVLVPPGRADELARATQSVVVDDELRRTLAEGSAAQAATFGIARCARRLEQLYRDLVADKPIGQ